MPKIGRKSSLGHRIKTLLFTCLVAAARADADADAAYLAYGYGLPYAYAGVPFGSSTGLDPITQGLDPVTQGALPVYSGYTGYKGNSGISNRGSVRIGSIESISISISRPLAKVVSIVSSKSGKSSSLGHRVKSLSDWVKASAGAKGNTSIGIGETITIGKVGSIS